MNKTKNEMFVKIDFFHGFEMENAAKLNIYIKFENNKQALFSMQTVEKSSLLFLYF